MEGGKKINWSNIISFSSWIFDWGFLFHKCPPSSVVRLMHIDYLFLLHRSKPKSNGVVGSAYRMTTVQTSNPFNIVSFTIPRFANTFSRKRFKMSFFDDWRSLGFPFLMIFGGLWVSQFIKLTRKENHKNKPNTMIPTTTCLGHLDLSKFAHR